MKFVIDCRCLRKAPTGVPNATLTIINKLSENLPDAEFHLISNGEFHEEFQKKLISRPNIFINISPFILFPQIAILWYIFKAPFIIRRIKPDTLIATAFLLPPFVPSYVKKIVIVHDLVFKKYPETMSFFNRLIFTLLHDKSIKEADLIWTFSNYTYTELLRFYPETSLKPRFTGFGIDAERYNRKLSDSEKQTINLKYDIKTNYILFVGTLEPRKNLKFLVSLVPELSKIGIQVVVVGNKGWGKSDTSIMDAPDFPTEYIKFLGFVSTEDLVKLYHCALAYISTSINEGLGMPQLEAMSAGCPVISPNNSAMTEVVQGSGELVDGWEKDEWVTTIKKVINNRTIYSQLGLQKIEKYKWEEIVKQFYYLIKQL